MDSSKNPSAGIRLLQHPIFIINFHGRFDFSIPKLTDIIVVSITTYSPPQKNIACGLHQPLSCHNSLAAVWIHAFTGVRRQDRRSRFFDL